jgi:lipid A 4'-phosphatase
MPLPDARPIEPLEAVPRPRRRGERRAILVYGAALVTAAAVFSLFPGIDLWASGLFYRSGAGFFLGDWWPTRTIYATVPHVTQAVVVGVPALFLLGLLLRRPGWRIDARAAAFLLLALALGPGLLVNTVLKDHWGRARPSQVTEFGGTKRFTPALLPSDQCERNCSFPAGHPATGFFLVSFAFLLRAPQRRHLAAAAAVAAGAVIGAARMAQGGHFLSDVVFAGFLVVGTSWLLYEALLVRDGLGRLARLTGATRPPRWLALAALGIGATALLSMAFLDRPIARLVHGADPNVVAVFDFITQFGLGKGYLIVSALLSIGLGLGASAAWTQDTALARRLELNAYRALFIFLVVAVSGLAADVLKVIFGRARPPLLFDHDVYGFAWGATQAKYWSLPSGHATTVAAVATAFSLLWPRRMPAYWLAVLLVWLAALPVMASRVIVGAHYPSDVIAGAALGAFVAWVIWLNFPRLSSPGRPAVPVSDIPENHAANRPGTRGLSRGRAE